LYPGKIRSFSSWCQATGKNSLYCTEHWSL
jgi:hypothetical protein